MSNPTEPPEDGSDSERLIPADVTVDLDRQQRCGYPEVIYGEGKTIAQMLEVATVQLAAGQEVLITRLRQGDSDELQKELAGIIDAGNLQLTTNSVARTLRIQATATIPTADQNQPFVAVLTAGTTDLPVAEEALETLAWMQVATRRISDVGVAGPHRLIEKKSQFQDATVIVVVAGMEGALPSVVAGHVDCPVVAVPTSVGYGANLGGISALLSMLNSCAANVSVVNIDAGFKAGYVAGLIVRKVNAGK